MQRYARPNSLDEALQLLAADTWRVLAGGTDFYPAQGARPLRDNVLDINALNQLRGISADADGWRIGARTTWSDIARAVLPPAFDGLKAAALEVGALQIQNAGTVAGNLCNASPAADGVPPLLTLDAQVEIRSTAGCRTVAIGDFILGNRRTALRAGEMVTAVIVPRPSTAGQSAFLKLGARRYLVISIAMVAVRLEFAQGRIAEAAVAVGACSAVATRLRMLEADLRGRPAEAAIADLVSAEHVAGLSPIDDVRASADYRRAAAREIVGRTLRAALSVERRGRAAA